MHKGPSSSHGILAREMIEGSPLPQRYHPIGRQPAVSPPLENSVIHTTAVRMVNKLEEEQATTNPKDDFFGSRIKYQSTQSGTSPEKDKTTNSQNEETDGGGSPSSQGLHEYSGVHVGHLPYDSVSTVAHENIPKLILDAVGWSLNVSEHIYF